jgi:predicted nucleotidyltransferase
MTKYDKTAIVALLPTPVRKSLEDLVSALQDRLGGSLSAVLMHGSAVRGGYVGGRSDVDLIVVVRRASRAALEAAGPALQLARSMARIECMILDEAEIAGAADVFPLLYDDVAAAHVTLVGDDPFTGLHIADEHRRLRIEQELRDARIRLRRLVVDAAGGPPEALVGPLVHKLKQLRSPLAALMRLRGDRCKDDLETVLRHAGKAFDVDDRVLQKAREAPGPALDALAALLDRAIAAVDMHDATTSASATTSSAVSSTSSSTIGGVA